MGVTQHEINVVATAGINTSSVYDLNDYLGASIFASWTDDTASYTAKTFDTGVAEVSTLTFDTKGNTTHGDYVVVYDVTDTAWAVAASIQGIQEVTDMTCVGDVVAVAEITEITAVADVSGSLDGTYFLLQDTNGSVAFWIDVDDSGTTIPSGASAADRAIEITTIATDDTAATIAGKLETAIHADSKFTASSASDVCTVTNADTEDLTDAADGDSGFGFSTTTQGVTADLLDGTYILLQDVNGSVAFWIDTGDSGTTIPAGAGAADRAVEITTVTSGMTASQVAGVVATAINADSKFAASAASEVVTITNADYKDLTDAADGDSGFTFNVTTQGADLGAEPSGAIWTAIPAAKKVQADLSADTTAANVAARFELAFDGLTGFTTVITSDDTAADGTMTMTQSSVGVTINPALKNADDSGAGSITSAETTAGVDEEVFIATEYLAIPSHGFLEGLCVQATTTGTLPAGLSLSTDYYVKVVDANTIQLSASQGGAAVNLTDTGTGVHTLTAESTLASTVTVQASQDGVDFRDTSDTFSISGTSSGEIYLTNLYYRYLRLRNVVTEGVTTVTASIQVKY